MRDTDIEDIIHDINQLFQETDIQRFGKNKNNLSQYVITDVPFSNSGIHFQCLKHTPKEVDKNERVSKIQLFEFPAESEDVTHLGRKKINEWLLQNRVKKILFTKAIRNFLFKRKHLDPWVLFKLIKTMKELEDFTAVKRKKSTEDLKREDFNFDILSEFMHSSNSIFMTYYLELFLKETVLFNKDSSRFTFRGKTTIKKFNHPLVNLCVTEMRKQGVKEISIENNLVSQVKRFFTWITLNIEEFKGVDVNHIYVHRITEEHLEEYKLFLISQVKEDILTELGAKRHLQYVKRFFTFLYQKKRLVRDIAINVTNLKAEEYKYRAIPKKQEVKQLFKVVLIYSDNPVKEKLAFSLMLYLGLRSEEVASLRWEDLNIQQKTIVINDSKGENSILPVPCYIVNLFKKLTPKTQGEIFSANPKDFKSKLYENYKLYTLIAGWNYEGGPHLLRHIYVTRLAETCTIPQMQLLSRHNSPGTTGKYIHFDRIKLRREMSKLKLKGGLSYDH